MKEKFQREYLRGTKFVIKGRLNDRHKIITINTSAVSLIRYGASIVKLTKSKLDEIDRKTKKVMALKKELQPRTDVNRLYVSRMER